MQDSCIAFLIALLHAPEGQGGFGVATTGSSEAILLACYAWRSAFPRNAPANMIISPASHSAWLDVAKFLGIEVRVCCPAKVRQLFGSVDRLEFHEFIRVDRILTFVLSVCVMNKIFFLGGGGE